MNIENLRKASNYQKELDDLDDTINAASEYNQIIFKNKISPSKEYNIPSPFKYKIRDIIIEEAKIHKEEILLQIKRLK